MSEPLWVVGDTLHQLEVLEIAAIWCNADGGIAGATTAAGVIFGHDPNTTIDAAEVWQEPQQVAGWLAHPAGNVPSSALFRTLRGKGGSAIVSLQRASGCDGGALACLLVAAAGDSELRRLQTARMESIASTSGAIGHKLNNVLAGLLGYVTLLRKAVEGDSKPEMISKYLGALDITGARVTELTQRLMVIAQKDTAPVAQIVDVLEIAGRVLGNPPDNLTITRSESSGTTTVYGEDESVGKIVEQLAVGVAEVLPGDREVTVTIEEMALGAGVGGALGIDSGRYVAISFVHDHDPVTLSTLERLFDPYFTIEGKGSGAEMFLTEAWGYTRLHQGAIQITSETEQRTRISVYLPVGKPV
jgi:signal transduction histidine kinase